MKTVFIHTIELIIMPIKKLKKYLVSFLMLNSKTYAVRKIKKRFLNELGYKLNLNNPKTFNEKLNWIKFYGINPLMSISADKYKVREYLKKEGFGEYLIPIYGVFNKTTELDWDLLPQSFVLKTNHNSGGVWIIKNKKNINKTRLKNEIKKSLNEVYGIENGEYHYKEIKPKIIAEAFLGNSNKIIPDYKFSCFNGKCYEMFITINREQGNPEYYFFNRDWIRIKYIYSNRSEPKSLNLSKPKKLSSMFDLAEKLSSPFDYVRVDLYHENNKIYFGELTFFPECGYNSITYKADQVFGKRLKINTNQKFEFFKKPYVVL